MLIDILSRYMISSVLIITDTVLGVVEYAVQLYENEHARQLQLIGGGLKY